MAKYLDGIQMMERSTSDYKLIATIPYSQLAANATAYKSYPSCLDRRASQRTFIIVNTLNQPTGAIAFVPFDNSIELSVGKASVGTANIGSIATVMGYVFNSEYAPVLASHVDSLQLNLTMGATAPTTGDIKFYVLEVF
jgi:hypothetical protein